MNEAIRQVTHVQNIRYDKATERLYIIDQTLLPNEEKEIELRTVEEMIEAIKMLRIRGAPAIGICAGYCMYALARDIDAKDNETFYRKLQIDGELLGAARPTAVNLRWAVGEMLDTAKAHLKDDRAELLEALYRKAVDIHEDDIAKCTAISEYGLSLLKDGDGVLTHCNAGPLATSRYGTGQGPFLLAAERGIHIRVFADETRPLLQGARLTSYELQRAGVDVTLICDNMASMVMKNGWVQACFVGCDRIAANGDFANKIGTSGVAILAKHYGIPFYVHVYVVPFTDFRQAVDVIVGNIHPARIADFSVDNHYLPVVAVHGMVDIGKGDGVELDEFDAACLYRLQMMFFQRLVIGPVAERIEHGTYLYTFFYLFCQ